MTERTDTPNDSTTTGRAPTTSSSSSSRPSRPPTRSRCARCTPRSRTTVVYHVLLPLEDAAARIEASLGTLGAGDLMAAPALAMNDVDIEALRRECEENSSSDLHKTLLAIHDAGGKATGKVTSEPPVDALAALVTSVDAREAIILTRSHVVAEFFHVDWTSRARRKLGVPVLHLIEHENFDEQASGSGEGVTGV